MLNNLLLFIDVSGGEFFVIVLAVFIVFGPKKIPEVARTIGKLLAEARKATSGIKDELNLNVEDADAEKSSDKSNLQLDKDSFDFSNYADDTTENADYTKEYK